MRIFSCGTLNTSQHLRVSTRHTEYTNFPPQHCGLDLNASIELLFSSQLSEFARDVQYLNLGDHYEELEDIWLGAMAVPNGGFNQLKTLIVDGCHFLSNNVIPFHLLGFLSNLEELQVRYCDSIKAIFEVGSLSVPFSIPLKTLILKQLPDLENVWNEDPQEILSFQSLQLVYVNRCRSLKSLFPASMATPGKIVGVEKLKVKHCEKLVEIVAKDETIPGGATSNSILFPSLTMLKLWELPKLKCIYSGLNNLEWPKLQELVVCQCSLLKNFPTLSQHHFLIDAEKVFPSLEHLSLCKESIMHIWQAPIQAKLLQKVKFLKLEFFDADSERFPYGFFQKELLPHLEKLQLSCGNFEEIFTSEISDMDGYGNMFSSRLKILELISLSKLNLIGLERTPLPRNLEMLKVDNCPCLINLTPSTVSFSNLRGLHVSDCDRLPYLFTSSMAKSFALLEELMVSKCKSIQQIMTEEGNESEVDEITFRKLKTLSLAYLESLERFQRGNSTLNFSSLEVVTVHQCLRMRIFSYGATNAPKLLRVSAKPPDGFGNSHPEYSGMDLNVSIELIFSSQLAQFSHDVRYLKLGDHLELQEIWYGVMPIPDGGFNKLKTLVVDGCQFLSHYVIPLHLLGLLSNLQELQVRNCDSIKVIFDVGLTASPCSLPLRTLSLEQLPSLEHVWKEDPQEFLSIQSLQYVYVDKCRSLKSLFPASMAQCQLQRLVKLCVQFCEELVEIVAKDKTTPGGETSMSNIFLNLTTLELWNLSQLKCIYQGLNNLEFPKLRVFDVYSCDQLKILPIDEEAFVPLEKVFPKLQQLSLSKENIMEINWQGQFQATKFLQQIKFLILQCFHEDLDGFPYGFFQRESLLNLEKLRVACSNFKEIFISQKPDENHCTEMLFSQLKDWK
ncbi:uncharacterized protein LOC129288217 [Prosopis cineraria]|uniref:uncharacterized protein LOC129288217 n=1 Tax=Prosopis cineraria TaxID=364024 RepID=UPI00241052F7|nr:uncharacterized protein LOC129288217 [Prosopis cineraria]